jgi:hypothetical protein
MAREYPRFLFSNPQNTKSKGPFIVHCLEPFCIFRLTSKLFDKTKYPKHVIVRVTPSLQYHLILLHGNLKQAKDIGHDFEGFNQIMREAADFVLAGFKSGEIPLETQAW